MNFFWRNIIATIFTRFSRIIKFKKVWRKSGNHPVRFNVRKEFFKKTRPLYRYLLQVDVSQIWNEEGESRPTGNLNVEQMKLKLLETFLKPGVAIPRLSGINSVQSTLQIQERAKIQGEVARAVDILISHPDTRGERKTRKFSIRNA